MTRELLSAASEYRKALLAWRLVVINAVDLREVKPPLGVLQKDPVEDNLKEQKVNKIQHFSKKF